MCDRRLLVAERDERIDSRCATNGRPAGEREDRCGDDLKPQQPEHAESGDYTSHVLGVNPYAR